MKKILILASILMLNSGNLSAQIGLRVYNLRPTGDYGAFFKPTISAELGFIKPFEKRFRPLAFFTIQNMKPRMDEFPISGERDSGNGVTIYPGTQSFKRFIMVQGHAGFDFAFLKKEKFSTFIGANIILGWAFVHYIIKNPPVKNEEGYVSGQEIGMQFRLGAEYQVTDQIGLQISATRDYYRMISEDIGGNFWANNYGVGVTYQF